MKTKIVTLLALILSSSIVFAQVSNSPFLPPVISYLLDENPAIAGTLSLPAGVTAGPGGVSFEVETFPRESYLVDGFFQSTVDTVTLAPGEASGDYFIDLDIDDATFDSYRVQFKCISGCDSIDVTTQGLWSDQRGVTSIIFADEYSSDRAHSVDLQLELADFFSGTVLFPAGFTAAGDEGISVIIRDSAPLAFESFRQFIFLESGDTQADFNFSAPTKAAVGGWIISATCTECDGLVTGARYGTTSSGDPADANADNAFEFAKGVDRSGITITIVEAAPAG